MEQKELYRAIDEILRNDWDPIGINNIAPRDEYQCYIPLIFELKMNASSTDIIAQKLFEIATKKMGLIGNIVHCKQIADKIVNL